jgi:hypothetical protein
MRKMLIAGLVLVALGIVALAVNVIPVRHQEQVAKIGSLTVNTEKETDYVIPNYVGIIAIVAGVVLVVAGTRRT